MVSVTSPLMSNSTNGNHSVKKPKMGVPEIQEIMKNLEEKHFRYPDKCALNIEVIDDTALIRTAVIGKGKINRNHLQESGKEKKGKRKWGKAKKKEKFVEKKEVGVVYSREELEILRFVDLENQKKKWGEIYCGLEASVAEEYDGLITSSSSSSANSVTKKHCFSSLELNPWSQMKKSANLEAGAAKGKRSHLSNFVH